MTTRKGQSTGNETAFIFGLIIFVAALAWFSTQTNIFGNISVNFAALGVEFVGIAGACMIVTGFACVAAVALSTVINFFIIPPVLTLLFTPIFVVLAYVIARLVRGGG